MRARKAVGGKDLGNKALGAYGEARAARWYEAHGYRVLERNWRCRDGEIDLIVALASTVVFCEVKTRRSEAYGLPVEAVGWKKQQRLRRLAAIWLQQSDVRPHRIRFDVASVVGGKVVVFDGAF
jgi:putative endonuclease